MLSPKPVTLQKTEVPLPILTAKLKFNKICSDEIQYNLCCSIILTWPCS